MRARLLRFASQRLRLSARRAGMVLLLTAALFALTGCGERPTPTPTRTPIPTYTPTPVGQQPPAPVAVAPGTESGNPPAPAQPTPTDTPVPPTDTPTPPPTDTPTPTVTPTPSATPTDTPTPTPTPTPDYPFLLEEAEQFPAQVAVDEEVRVYVYVYSEGSFALPGYSVRVEHDGKELPVQAKSVGGLPGETRPGPSPYTRFANLGIAFLEPPEGVWTIQLVKDGEPVGPPASFILKEGDELRELYVRYRLKEE